MYRVIRKSLRDFRPLRYSSRDSHAEGEHVNRARHTPSFCPTLQVITGLTSATSPRVDILSTCKVGRNLECLSLCWHAPCRRDHPSYCTAEVGNPGGTYELLCISKTQSSILTKISWLLILKIRNNIWDGSKIAHMLHTITATKKFWENSMLHILKHHINIKFFTLF